MIKRKAKIVATLGPSSGTEEMVEKLILAGMDVARLNFSHGTHENHAERIRMIRQISLKLNKSISILQDLQGPKMRVGDLPEDGIHLCVNDKVFLHRPEASVQTLKPDPDVIAVPFDVPNLGDSLEPGNRILLDDGNLELEVITSSDEGILTRVIMGGILSSHKGVNFPTAHLNIPGFTEKDQEDLKFGLTQDIDYIALSFVNTAHDIEIVRKFIADHAPERSDTPIIAKMERPSAIENLIEILQVSDGVMVARGDLAVETSPALVPVMQKRIIQEANNYNKIVITATQMLDSMIHNPRPTRAEASDVANAVFDGTDAVMLSGETASGQFPLESVVMMDSIVREAEKNSAEWGHCVPDAPGDLMDDATSLTRAARELAQDRDVAGIAVFTQSGRTARLMSKARPGVPILAFSPHPRTYHRLTMMWGVIPFLVPFADTVESIISTVDAAIFSLTPLQPGQQVVLISGFPVGDSGPPNFLLLHTIGEKG
ncbi:MAG: pyruvate kinase [Anaerolineaceae bacterium]